MRHSLPWLWAALAAAFFVPQMALAQVQPSSGLQRGGANVVMPNAATALSKWTTQIHQNGQTGSCYGTGPARVLCASDQNMDLIADHATVQTQDASLITYATVGGVKTTADVVGLDWTINSVLYQIRYTVQAGDTLTTIATNLAACINAGGATNCTVTAGFITALQAFHDANGFGYKPTASSGGTTKIAFDQPWAAAGNSVVSFLSGLASETLTLTGGTVLDNGPYMATSRLVPGRTPVAGDQIGTYYYQGQSTGASGIDTQYAVVIPRVLAQDATNPQGELLLATSDSASAKNSSPKLYVGNGVVTADSAGANCGYLGLGTLGVCGQLRISSATNPQLLVTPTGAADFQGIFDTGPTGSNSYFVNRYRGANMVQFGEFGSNSWALYDTSGNGHNGNFLNYTPSSGLIALGNGGQLSLTLAGGAQLGAPTGGDKGAGTLNLAAGGVYDNGTAPTGTGGYVHATGPTLTTPTLSGQIDEEAHVTTGFSSVTATGLATIAGFDQVFTAAGYYSCHGYIHFTTAPTSSNGFKIALVSDGTVSVTALAFNASALTSAGAVATYGTATALGSNAIAASLAMTDVFLKASIKINAGGTIHVQANENAASGTVAFSDGNGTWECHRAA